MKRLRLAFILLATVFPLSAGSASAARLAPAGDLVLHQAVYDLRIGENSKNGGGTRLIGRIVYELGATCDDYLTNQRFVTRGPLKNGRALVTDTRAIMLESREGSKFRFKLQTYRGKKLMEAFAGRAEINVKDSSGRAMYEEPKNLQRDLPAGVAFPVTMSRQLLAAARNGENRSEALVFDGSKVGLYRVVVFIGARQEPDEAFAKAYPIFAGQSWWRMRAAYYPLDDDAITPDFEFGSRFYDNGAASHIVLDYGYIKLVGELSSVTVTPQPECG